MAGLPVNNDILDRILTFLPDFNCLHSYILVCTTFYKVYARRPKSICRKIASNIVGPVDAALDVARFQDPYHGGSDEVDKFPREEHEFPVETFLIVPTIVQRHDTHTFSRSVIAELHYLGRIADSWEDDFCLRWKDRRSTARLTPPESFRFRRVIYRLMLFHKAHDFWSMAEALDELTPSPSQLQHMFQAKVDFLNQLSTDELYQLQAVTAYMTQIRVPGEGETIASPEDQLSRGPDLLYQNLESGDMPPEPTLLNEQYLLAPLEATLHRRGAPFLHISNKIWNHILSKRFGRDDPCAHCGRARRLWNRSNWAFLTRLLPSSGLGYDFTLVPGCVRENFTLGPTVKRDLFRILRNPGAYFSQAFTLRSLAGDFADWTLDQGTCKECLMKIVWDSFPPVWRARLWYFYGKTLPEENCPDGWNCGHQVLLEPHAAQLNHFCRPVRGNPDPIP